MTKRLDVVDFLRGFSIFTIALMHLLQSYPLPAFVDKAASFGGAGVHVFILCSGFGLYLSHLYKPLSYQDFLRRRFSKIYLPYAIIILLTALWGVYQSGVFEWKTVLSHLLLYKMFIPQYEGSFGEQMWFISTIIQFYLVWPFMVKLIKTKWSLLWGLLISLGWATLVGMLGYEEERVWNSFFLQYVWEFVLGMWIAKKYHQNPEIKMIPNWTSIIVCLILGMGLTGFMAWNGGILKLYNDIPSLAGYLAVLLFIYKLSVPFVNRFFCYTNSISYEWYLVHTLAFGVVKSMIHSHTSLLIEFAICLLASYFCAYLYDILLRRCHIK